MKRKLSVILLLLCSFSLFASVHYKANIDAAVGYNLATMRESYLKTVSSVSMPKTRSQAAFFGDIIPFGMQIGEHISFGAGGSLSYITRSNVSHSTQLRRYQAFGITAYFDFAFNYRWSAGIKGRVLWCRYIPFQDRFAAFDIEPYAKFCFFNRRMFSISAIAPVTIHIKKDVLSVRPSLGVDIAFKGVNQ